MLKNNFINKYKNNYLFFSGIIFFIVGIISKITFDYYFDYESISSRHKFFENFFFNFLIAIFIVPPLEEITFRGLFYKIKFKLVFYFGSCFFIFFSENFYLLILIAITIFLIENKIIDKFRLKQLTIYILTTVIFALVHYKLSDFKSFLTIVTCLVQFGIGFILIWFTINFGLKISIFLHSLYNLILLIPVFISLQFFSSEYNVSFQDYMLICKETPLLTRNSSFEWKNDLPQATNVTLEDFYLSVCNKDTINIERSEKNITYDFKIVRKANTNQNFDCRILKTMLQKIVIEKNKN